MQYEQKFSHRKKRNKQARRFGQTDDYANHTAHLVRCALQEGPPHVDNVRTDRIVGICVTKPCSVCAPELTQQSMFWQTAIPATRLWFPISDMEAARLQVLQGAKAYGRVHGSMAEAVLSRLHRPDFTQVPCSNHPQRKDAFAVTIKDGPNARLPRMLELDNGSAGVMPESGAAAMFALRNGLIESFSVGELKYDLIAMTFYNGNHYTASVFLNGSWWKYNDMGHQPSKPGPRTEAQLIPCPDFKTAATPAKNFHHRGYIFSLVGEHPGERATEHTDWKDFEDPQFNSLDILAGSDDESAVDGMASPEI
jgi:hypothetical protein